MPAPAAISPFNPGNLDSTRLTRVDQVCETVLGLSPDEPLEGGYRTGDDRLDFWTSHYRGCIVSLSYSLRAIGETPMSASVPESTPATPGPGLTEANRSFTYASPHEIARREELACGSLGLNLSRDEFNSCVTGLSQTFYSVEHPIG